MQTDLVRTERNANIIPCYNLIENDKLIRCKRYMELDKLCNLALTIGEQALLGIPKEDRIEFSPHYAPYNPDNLRTWQEAANLGVPNGCFLLGQNLINGGETEEGLRWLETAISKGHRQAKRALGEFLLDYGKTNAGLRLLEEAADSGDACACDCLAHRYDDGNGVPQSKSKYRSYLKRAARLGSHMAQLFLEADKSIPFWRRW